MLFRRSLSLCTFLAVTSFLCLGTTAPNPRSHHHRRQSLSQTLGSLAGEVGLNQTFDYVIIGGGTAGLVMANRLSEDPTVQVAVIEAGTFYEVAEPVLASTPGGDVMFVGTSIVDSDPTSDWEFVTTPQTGAGNRNVHYCRGKCLGGSSARNFMIYQRGTVDSYQQWADAVDDQSYAFANFEQYFQKGTTFTPPNMAKREANATALYDSSAFSATGEPLHVSYANYAQTFSTYLNGAMTDIGIPEITDFNSGKLIGHQFCSSTIDPSNANRASSQETYLQAAMGRTNLKVFDLSTAQRILFDGNKNANGVLVATAGVVPYVLSARKEVILSAGAFQSPQLLMLSGIGPSATLKQFGIPVLVENNNVGQNMWDHVFAGPSYRVNLITLTEVANNPAYVAAQLVLFETNQSGPLTNPVSDYLGWEKVPQNLRSQFPASVQESLAQFPADWPEIEYISGAGYVGDFSDLILTQPKDGYQYATILSTLVAPHSRGNVTLASASADDLPIINPNWLTHPTDQAVAVAAFKRARQAFASKTLQSVVIGEEYFPGMDVSTDAQILENYRNTLQTVWHASCTCKMGKVGDSTAVVDPQARVMGVKGLRVVDASAFPLLPPGHPQSTIYALAEKIADDIKTGQ